MSLVVLLVALVVIGGYAFIAGLATNASLAALARRACRHGIDCKIDKCKHRRVATAAGILWPIGYPFVIGLCCKPDPEIRKRLSYQERKEERDEALRQARHEVAIEYEKVRLAQHLDTRSNLILS